MIVAGLLGLGLANHPLGTAREFVDGQGLRIIARRSDHPYWHIVSDAVGWVDRQGHQQLQHCVSQKSPREKSYIQLRGSDVRLLVVADATLNSGKLTVDPNASIDTMGFTYVYFLFYPREVMTFSNTG